MNLYEQWEALTKKEMSPQENKTFWEDYFLKEKNIYENLLQNKRFNIDMTFKEFSLEQKLDKLFVMGFLDGINTSLKQELELNLINEESELKFEIDIEKLFYNMHAAGADWLYGLPQWEEILSIERRKEIEKEYKASKTVVLELQTGRNDPCPCGSGKKYKKCCG